MFIGILGAISKICSQQENNLMNRIIEILMVEDNPSDIRLAQECFRGNKIANTLHIVENELELLAYLRKQGKYTQAVQPDIVLFCLKKLINQGLASVVEVKQDATLAHIPVVALTGFEGEEAVFPGDQSLINFYISKPITLDQIRSIVTQVEDFAFTIVRINPDEDSSRYARA